MSKQVNTGKVLKAIREKNDWTLEEMAKRLGTTKQALSRYERGERQPKLPVAARFAEILGITLEDLAGTNDTYHPDIISLSELQSHRIKLIGSAAAGEPVFDEEYNTYVDGPMKADCAIRVKGMSMEPTYINGDLLYIRAQPDVDHDGQIAVVICGDEACVKHVYHHPEGLFLISDNPKYPPMLKKASDFDGALRILGKVIGFTRMFE